MSATLVSTPSSVTATPSGTSRGSAENAPDASSVSSMAVFEWGAGLSTLASLSVFPIGIGGKGRAGETGPSAWRKTGPVCGVVLRSLRIFEISILESSVLSCESSGILSKTLEASDELELPEDDGLEVATWGQNVSQLGFVLIQRRVGLPRGLVEGPVY